MPNDLICHAIRVRVLLEFEYSGLWRVVAPYCHGFTKRGEVLRGVQIRGGSSSGGLGFGKLWRVSEMTKLRAGEEAFVADDPDYHPNDSAMLRIHCRV
jgi:hypothetical protein